MRHADPGPPTNLTIRLTNSNRLLVSWSPPSSGASRVTYHYYENTSNSLTGKVQTNETSVLTAAVLTSTTYYVHVRATTGTYLSVTATSETVTVIGKYTNNYE